MSKFADEDGQPLFADEPKFADEALPVLADFKTGTVAWLIQRVLDDIAGQVDAKQLGYSHLCGLKAMQRMPIGQKKVFALKRSDFIDFIRWRRDQVVPHSKRKIGAATARQTLNYLSGVLKYACATWDDCEELVPVMVQLEAADEFLGKRGLIGKAQRRTRRPSDQEVERLMDYYARHPGRVLRMQEVIAFCLASARRRGEVCRITWGDVDFENKVYWVRDVKHPTKKKGNDKKAILFPVIEQIIRRQPRLRPDDPTERVFPFIPESVSQSFIAAKKAIAAATGDASILTLRLHDHRAEAISKWLLKMPPEDVRVGVSLHNTTNILETVYDRRDATDLLKGKYAGLMEQPEAR